MNTWIIDCTVIIYVIILSFWGNSRLNDSARHLIKSNTAYIFMLYLQLYIAHKRPAYLTVLQVDFEPSPDLEDEAAKKDDVWTNGVSR